MLPTPATDLKERRAAARAWLRLAPAQRRGVARPRVYDSNARNSRAYRNIALACAIHAAGDMLRNEDRSRYISQAFTAWKEWRTEYALFTDYSEADRVAKHLFDGYIAEIHAEQAAERESAAQARAAERESAAQANHIRKLAASAPARRMIRAGMPPAEAAARVQARRETLQ